MPSSKALQHETKLFCRSFQLTPRESEVVGVLVEGTTRIKEVADRLRLSPNTINNHVNSILLKTGTRSKSELLSMILKRMADELMRCKLLSRRPEVLVLSSRPPQELRRLIDSIGPNYFNLYTASLTTQTPHFLLVEEDFYRARRLTDPQLFNASSRLILFTDRSRVLDFEPRAMAMAEGALDLLSFTFGPGPLPTAEVENLRRLILGHYAEDDVERSHFFASDIARRSFSASRRLPMIEEEWGHGGFFLDGERQRETFDVRLQVDDWVEVGFEDPQGGIVNVQGDVVWVREKASDQYRAGVGIRAWPRPARPERRPGAVYIPDGRLR